ncbi:MAG: aspartate--tRNA ligase [Candidatus Omnitrophica bacterium]|nr:aspartate--tRNA ligase [Candidatus Omnitrophota bacterium]MDD5488092.1 aspartate--tRNA ligase [Candidatus Omnitrophota bacterium]
MIRTHTCGELTAAQVSEKVTLAGWIASRRDHGEIIFMDLRDKHGITQIVLDPERNRQAHEEAHKLRSEYCVRIKGIVSKRPEGTVNEKLVTGEIEIDVSEIEVLSVSETPMFEITDDIDVSEDLRMRYRYLDLRRPSMQEKLAVKHRVYKFIYDFLDKEGFISVETPMLTKSTPEGARDFLVPSRLQQGSFYALPQSPQLFKQILMVSGVEKYFQIVRCFRDEDFRADRQPEFTQLDMEMSFVEQEDILDVSERLFKGIFSKILGIELTTPFRRMTYKDAVELYGSDKPDTRFDILLHDLSEDVAGSDFKVFNTVLASGGKVKGIAAPGYAGISRKDIDALTSFVGEYGAKGLAYFKVEENGLNSPITKFFPAEILEKLRRTTGASTGDMIFIVADDKDIVRDALGALRLKIGRDKGLIDKKRFDLLWVVDFPLFTRDKETGRWASEHHPFTYFREEDAGYLDSGDLDRIRSTSYDLVLNGSEIGSGSIRIHRKDIQNRIFEVLGLSAKEAGEKFGFLLEAFSYGPPPHGGIAFGLDRLTTVLTGDSSIREVIPFPKTQKGVCLLTGAPSEVDDTQLAQLGVKTRKKTN